MASIVHHQRTGLHFEAGNANGLVEALRWWDEHPAEAALMRTQARLEYETKYTADGNYAQLINIYDSVLNRTETLSWLATASATAPHAEVCGVWHENLTGVDVVAEPKEIGRTRVRPSVHGPKNMCAAPTIAFAVPLDSSFPIVCFDTSLGTA